MYVRIARFESGERNWDEFAVDVREAIRSGGKGTPIEAVSDVISRVMLLVDRESGRGANLIVSDTAEDMRRIDDAFNQITPAGGRGARTSVEIYEVLMDEAPSR